jgi:hypothetical protein
MLHRRHPSRLSTAKNVEDGYGLRMTNDTADTVEYECTCIAAGLTLLIALTLVLSTVARQAATSA